MTQRQLDVLAFIVSYQQAHGGVSPSFGEIGAALGTTSKSTAFRLLRGLEEQGFIRRLKNRARCIEVLRAASGAVAGPSAAPATAMRTIPLYALHARPTAATDRYPFLAHPTCAEWGTGSLHGVAA
ncbi:MarR family transcriptional regulator [Sphingomonas sp. C8-2]|nr:MarR family transcriptional regulator [Sphingomonas sp. C8-2]